MSEYILVWLYTFL